MSNSTGVQHSWAHLLNMQRVKWACTHDKLPKNSAVLLPIVQALTNETDIYEHWKAICFFHIHFDMDFDRSIRKIKLSRMNFKAYTGYAVNFEADDETSNLQMLCACWVVQLEQLMDISFEWLLAIIGVQEIWFIEFTTFKI